MGWDWRVVAPRELGARGIGVVRGVGAARAGLGVAGRSEQPRLDNGRGVGCGKGLSARAGRPGADDSEAVAPTRVGGPEHVGRRVGAPRELGASRKWVVPGMNAAHAGLGMVAGSQRSPAQEWARIGVRQGFGLPGPGGPGVDGSEVVASNPGRWVGAGRPPQSGWPRESQVPVKVGCLTGSQVPAGVGWCGCGCSSCGLGSGGPGVSGSAREWVAPTREWAGIGVGQGFGLPGRVAREWMV